MFHFRYMSTQASVDEGAPRADEDSKVVRSPLWICVSKAKLNLLYFNLFNPYGALSNIQSNTVCTELPLELLLLVS